VFLPTPTLDDTRWGDLVEQSRALLPVYAPEWTDHNVSDPGITLLDLFAWFAEMQTFQLDQVPESHRRAFLALVGVRPEPPRAARVALRFAVPDGAAPAALPAGLACTGTGPDGVPVGFRIRHGLQVVAGRIASLTAVGGSGRLDLSPTWLRHDPVAPFGSDPSPGASMEISFSAPLPDGIVVTLSVSTAAGRDAAAPPRQHDVEIAWEAQTATGHWSAVTLHDDGTRALTRDGRVELELSAPAQVLRVRYVRGAYDAPPSLRDVALNGADAVQESAITDTWEIAPTATIVGTPTPGMSQPLAIEVDRVTGMITLLDVTAASAPSVRILDYEAAQPGAPGELTVAAKALGRSTGDPGQVFEFTPAPLEAASVRIYTGRASTWRRFHVHGDLIASGPADAHVTLTAETGRVGFGDGWHGVVPPAGELVLGIGRSTLAEKGNAKAGTLDTITDAAPAGVSVSQPLDAAGGGRAETLGEAEARAEQLTGMTTRAVTVADIEALARATPGTQIARVAVLPELHPAFPCVRAPGVITVVVVPWLPAGRPSPSPGLRRAVAAQLAPHRLVGTRLTVAGPRYVTVTVVATLAAGRLAVPAEVRRRAVDAVNAFLDPLTGGPAGTGWPFGRDVVRAEVLQVLDDVAGVEHVTALELIGPNGESCGNLCLGPLELVEAGEHAIEVVPA
jgi:predicted phage baseplate assembly protein